MIGKKNLDLHRFRDQQASGRRALWRWPAFFVTFYWLLYRKLWGWAAAYFFTPPAVVAALLGVMAATGRAGQTIAGLGWLVFLALFFIAPPMLAGLFCATRDARSFWPASGRRRRAPSSSWRASRPRAAPAARR
ncbi:MAG: DUF2628 domain-containing protein [Rubrivivax sp.]